MKFLKTLKEKDPSSSVVYHLEGLLEAARNIEDWLVKLGDLPELNQEDTATTIVSLEVEIYDHLLYHMKELRHPLRRLRNDISGYNLHITRAEHWFEASSEPLLLDEINQLVESDAELTVSSTHFYDRLKEEGTSECIHAILWTAHPQKVPLWFRDGEITAKNPDDATIVKMLEIAEKVQAQVLGDDGEVYRTRSAPPGWEISE